VVACVATLGRKGSQRIGKFKPEDFTIIVADEAHKSVSPIWLRTLHFLGVHPENFEDGKLLVGLTATAYRGDGKSLGFLYDDIFTQFDIRYGMKEGWLTDIDWVTVKTDTDIASVKVNGGEFAQGELTKKVDNPVRNAQIVKAYMEHSMDEPAIVFCAGVQHAYTMADMFNQAGIAAECIEGGTEKEVRKDWIGDYRSGKIKVLLNHSVFCLDEETEILTEEGWVGIEEMDYSKRVANFDPETRNVFFKEPKFIIKRDRLPGERMVSFKSDRMNYRVTEHHRMLGFNKFKQSFYEKKAIDIVGQKPIMSMGSMTAERSITFTPQQEPPRKTAARTRSLSYIYRKQGQDQATARLNAEIAIAERDGLRYKTIDELTVDDCLFLGFFLGDGHYGKKHGGGTGVSFASANVYPVIQKWVDDLFLRLNFDFYRGVRDTYIVWSIGRGTGFGPQKKNGFYSYTPYLVKTETDWIYSLNKDQFDALLVGLHIADGTHGNAVVEQIDRTNINTVFFNLADAIQAVGCTYGYRISVSHITKTNPKHRDQKNIYIIKAKSEKDLLFHTSGVQSPQIEPGWKQERVWCVTSDTTFIITRRGGRVLITGNTTGFDAPETTTIIMARPIRSTLTYTQAIGRGLRPSASAMVDLFLDADARRMAIENSDKPACKLIDFEDNVGNHNVCRPPILFGLNPNAKSKKPKTKLFKEVVEVLDDVKAKAQIDTSKLLDLDDIHIVSERKRLKLQAYSVDDVIKSMSIMMWLPISDTDYELLLPKNDKAIIVAKNMLDQYELHETDLKSNIATKLQVFSSLQGAIKTADDYVHRVGYDTTFQKNDSAWRGKGVSGKQAAILRNLFKGGCRFGPGRYPDTQQLHVTINGRFLENSGEASTLINDRFNKK
jgi:hypothetical protein